VFKVAQNHARIFSQSHPVRIAIGRASLNAVWFNIGPSHKNCFTELQHFFNAILKYHVNDSNIANDGGGTPYLYSVRNSLICC